MQLDQNRPRVKADPTPIADHMTKAQIQRMGAVEAAFVICGAVSGDEVFTSDVIDVAIFILGDAVCGFQWIDGNDHRECALVDGHPDQGSWHVDRSGVQYHEVPF